MPPPELHFGRWHESIARLRSLKFKRIAPTHFGMYEDSQWQLNELERNLTAVEKWLEEVMPADPPVEELREKFAAWMESQARTQGLSEAVLQAYIVANPVGMSADGLLRYWKKVRMANVGSKS